MTWAGVLRRAQQAREVRVAKTAVPHPSKSGATRSLGLPRGQRADWRWPLTDGGCLHVHDLGDCWAAHVDAVDPDRDVPGHLRADVPGAWVAVIALCGGAVGSLVGCPWLGLAAGAGLGRVSHRWSRRR